MLHVSIITPASDSAGVYKNDRLVCLNHFCQAEFKPHKATFGLLDLQCSHNAIFVMHKPILRTKLFFGSQQL